MPEVAEAEVVESQADDASEESVETPATPGFDEATWKKRLAGKDQALTAAQREREAIKAERDALAKWKAEREGSDMTELEKANARAVAAEERAKQAEAAATAAKLAREYPLAAEALGDDIALLTVERIAELNGRLSQEAEEEESEPEPRTDPNQPRRGSVRTAPRTIEDAKADLTAQGNPFYDANF